RDIREIKTVTTFWIPGIVVKKMSLCFSNTYLAL
ncbi:unnamed protein product, partial [Rotaria sp. Silwood1]